MIGRLLTSEDRVLDIGACTGLTSAICAKRIGSERVLSYEANTRLQRVIANGSVTTLTVGLSGPTLRTFNDTSHFDQHPDLLTLR